MDEMLHHTRAVVRGTQRALVVGDMPFLSYADPARRRSTTPAASCARRARRVKVEGGVRSARIIETLVRAGIPVMGHIGWTPQAMYGMGGKTRVQGKDRDRPGPLLADALAVQEAGAFAVVLELVPEQLAAAITERLRIPTIGIGAGAGCSGQVQVITDLLGLGTFIPRHARPFADLRRRSSDAARPTRRMSARARSRARRRRCAWTRRCSRTCSAGRPRPAGAAARRRPRSLAAHPARPGPLTRRDPGPAHPRGAARALAAVPRPVGLVPTMGWLHDGHRSLMAARPRRMRRRSPRSSSTRASSATRPTSTRYPRNEARDVAICTEEGVDLVWAPPVEEVYPPGFDTAVRVGAISRPWRAPHGPGHFEGVATVVAILFGLVGAEHAYFGQKDAQQVMVIRRMALDLALPTRGHRLPHGPGSRWPGALVAQRAAGPR